MLWKNNFLRVNPLSNVSWCPCALLIPFLTVKRMLLINRWTQTVHYKIKSIYWQSISYPFVEETNPTLHWPFGTLLVVHTSQRGGVLQHHFFFFFVWHLCLYGKSLSENHPYPQYALQCQYMRSTMIMAWIYFFLEKYCVEKIKIISQKSLTIKRYVTQV